MCACVVVVFSVACASRKATRADAPAMATASVLQGSAAAGAQPLVAAAAAGACRCHDTQRSAETHQLSGATLTLAASAAAPAPAPAGTGWRRRWTACLALGLMIKFGLGTLVVLVHRKIRGIFERDDRPGRTRSRPARTHRSSVRPCRFHLAPALRRQQQQPVSLTMQCVPGITTPIMLVDGGRSVNCASNDGAQCLWGSCPAVTTGSAPFGMACPVRQNRHPHGR